MNIKNKTQYEKIKNQNNRTIKLRKALRLYDEFLYRTNMLEYNIKKTTKNEYYEKINDSLKHEFLENGSDLLKTYVTHGDYSVEYDCYNIHTYEENDNVCIEITITYKKDLGAYKKYAYYLHGQIIKISMSKKQLLERKYDNYTVKSLRDRCCVDYYGEYEDVENYFYNNKGLVARLFGEYNRLSEEQKTVISQKLDKLNQVKQVFPIELIGGAYVICNNDEESNNIHADRIVDSKNETVVELDGDIPFSVSNLNVNISSMPQYLFASSFESLGSFDEVYQEFEEFSNNQKIMTFQFENSGTGLHHKKIMELKK